MTDTAQIAGLLAAPQVRAQAGQSIMAPAEAARQRGAWALLAETAAADNFFFHPDFALPAIEAFGAGRVSIAMASASGRLAAAAPLKLTRLGRVTPAVRLWSHPYGPLGTPLLASDDVNEAASALLAALSPKASSRAIIVPDLPLESPAATALARAARASRRSTAVLDRHTRAVATRDSEAPQLAGLSRHRRHEYARLLRRLSDGGDVQFETAAGPEAVRVRFEEFLLLEAAGWKGIAGTALGADPARAAFARQAVASRAAEGAVRIHTLRLNGKAIAGLVNFICGTTAYTWKIAYDEEHARFSPGAQLLLAAAGSLLADPGIDMIDSCAGANHVLADPLLPGRIQMGTLVISPVGEGSLYRAGLAAARVEAAMVATARRIRDRLA